MVSYGEYKQDADEFYTTFKMEEETAAESECVRPPHFEE